MLRRVFLLVAVLTALCGMSNAAIMRVDVPSSEYEAFAATPRFDSVGCVYALWETGWLRGSGVLIHPEFVLTAGHNILGNDDLGGGISEVLFYTGPDISEYQHRVSVAQWFIYPGYTDAHPTGTGVDLALLHLSTPITDITPAERFYGTDQRGVLGFMAGYGMYGTPVTGPVGSDYLKRAGENIISEFGGDLFLSTIESHFMLSWLDYPGSSAEQPLEWGGAPGDSGGGWFRYIPGEGSRLVGISSFVWGTDPYYYGSWTGAVRVSLFNEWIDDIIRTHEIPEPSTFLIMASGFVLLLVFRRRLSRRT